MATYRADHVGSFLRPPELLEARTAHAEGRLDDAGLRQKEDAAILTMLELERQIGIDVYSDGEYRRGMWITGLPAAVDGFGAGAMLNIKNWRGRPLPYVPGQTGTRHAAAAGQNPRGRHRRQAHAEAADHRAPNPRSLASTRRARSRSRSRARRGTCAATSLARQIASTRPRPMRFAI